MNKLLLYLFVFGSFYTTHATFIEAIENPPINLFACDDNADGFAVFDLTINNAIVLGSQNPTDFLITYHLTQADADSDVAAIPNPSAFTSTTTIIFIRVEDITDGSFETGAFNLIVNAIPNVPSDLGDLEVCGDGAFAQFDLTVFDSIATGGDPDLVVEYFASLADFNASNPIVNPTLYTNVVNPQLIYVRVTDITTSCSSTSISTITLIVQASPPIATPLPDLIQCNDGSNQTVFDLTTNTTTILGDLDPTNFTVTYYETQIDATNDILPIGDPGNYLVIAPGTVIWTRLQDETTSCFSIASFDLIIADSPILSQNTPFNYTFCEQPDGDDSQGEVDLTTLADDANFLEEPQNTADFNISYHNTAIEAENNSFPIDQSVLLTVNDDNELFFRIENIATGCTSFGGVIFTVESQPEVNPVEDMLQCADDPGVNGIPMNEATFDLTTQVNIITGGDPELAVGFYANEADIENGNVISNPEAFTSGSTTIIAEVINLASSSCTSLTTFDLEVLPLPFVALEETCFDSENPNELDGSVEDPIPGAIYAYVWTRDDVLVSLEPTVTINQEGLYEITCTATYDNGTGMIISCDYVASLSVLSCPTDTDSDGVADEDEDVNNNGDLNDDDTDNDGIPNYQDDDDDGDLVMTIDEITGIGAGVAPQDFIDTDDDTIENYLDDDDDGDSVLTIHEDYNNSGSPLDDDTNDNGIPDFLDPEVALSTNEFEVTHFSIYPNPAIDQITITTTIPFEKIRIYDITGKVVKEIDTNSGIEQTFAIDQLKTGLYFISVNTSDTIFKLLKM